MDIQELSTSLRSAIAALHKGFRKHLYSELSFSLTEMEVIGHLYRSSPMLPSELSALARVKAQSMSQILNKLEEQGVVRRKPSREDKRKVYIYITAPARKMLEKTVYDRDEWLAQIIDKTLSASERNILVKALPVLQKLLKESQA